MRRARLDVVMAAAVAALAAFESGAAAETRMAPLPTRVPLEDNFSRFELVMTLVGAVAGITTMAFGPQIFGSPRPSVGPPEPGSFDRVWADRLHLDDGRGHHFLGQVPDIAGMYVLPFVPAVFYGIDATAITRSGAPWWLADPNQDHRVVAYAEALGWTMTATGLAKVLVGRTRPYAVLDHPELAGRAREVDVSFFSGHTAAMFTAATFISLDASRRLSAGVLAGAPAWKRVLLGTVVPYTVAFGTASLVGVSRVIDQQHWPSDVLMGALVGSTIAHLAYLTHFDDTGQPRRRLDAGIPVRMARLIPTLNGAALVGAF